MDNKSWLSVENWNIEDWIWYILSTEDSDTIRTILTGIWVIWFNRNLSVHGKSALSINVCVFKAKHYLHQFDLMCMMRRRFPQNASSNDDDTINFFTDGSWSQVNEGGWAAIVVVNNKILRCHDGFNINSNSAFEEELYGIIGAFCMAHEMGLTSANFFCDSTDIIWSLNSGSGGHDSLLDIMTEAISLLRKNPGWKLLHLLREDNALSDFLAHKARTDHWKWEAADVIPLIPRAISVTLSQKTSFLGIM